MDAEVRRLRERIDQGSRRHGPLAVSQSRVAEVLGFTRQRLNAILRSHRTLSPMMTKRIDKAIDTLLEKLAA